ncbi:MAG: glutaredoxin, partial [Clostridiales bacterium]|nr:glutaredoxin [Clostridiales bacterium]
MKIIMYGAAICPDCVSAKELLSEQTDIELDYRDITASIPLLKEFLSFRDNEAMFDPIKEGDKVGIPFFVLEDGRKTFDAFEQIGI